MGGRPRKPIAQIKAGGAYIPGRHAERDRTEPRPGGSPVKPDGLGPIASESWDRNVPALVKMGVATSADQDALEAMVKWWELFKLAMQEGEVVEAERASKSWLTYASKFGLTPADRAKIVANVSESDDFAELLKVV